MLLHDNINLMLYNKKIISYVSLYNYNIYYKNCFSSIDVRTMVCTLQKIRTNLGSCSTIFTCNINTSWTS